MLEQDLMHRIPYVCRQHTRASLLGSALTPTPDDAPRPTRKTVRPPYTSALVPEAHPSIHSVAPLASRASRQCIDPPKYDWLQLPRQPPKRRPPGNAS